MDKRLYRSNNKIIAGVCAGIAEYFDIDPTLVRIAWALTALLMGSGVLAYIICAIVIPQNPNASTAQPASSGAVPARLSAAQYEPGEEAGEAQQTEGTPEAGDTMPAASQASQKSSDDVSLILGLVLIVVGGLFLARKFFHWLDMGIVWAGLLVVFGLYLIFKSSNKR